MTSTNDTRIRFKVAYGEEIRRFSIEPHHRSSFGVTELFLRLVQIFSPYIPEFPVTLEDAAGLLVKYSDGTSLVTIRDDDDFQEAMGLGLDCICMWIFKTGVHHRAQMSASAASTTAQTNQQTGTHHVSSTSSQTRAPVCESAARTSSSSSSSASSSASSSLGMMSGLTVSDSVVSSLLPPVVASQSESQFFAPSETSDLRTQSEVPSILIHSQAQSAMVDSVSSEDAMSDSDDEEVNNVRLNNDLAASTASHLSMYQEAASPHQELADGFHDISSSTAASGWVHVDASESDEDLTEKKQKLGQRVRQLLQEEEEEEEDSDGGSDSDEDEVIGGIASPIAERPASATVSTPPASSSAAIERKHEEVGSDSASISSSAAGAESTMPIEPEVSPAVFVPAEASAPPCPSVAVENVAATPTNPNPDPAPISAAQNHVSTSGVSSDEEEKIRGKQRKNAAAASTAEAPKRVSAVPKSLSAITDVATPKCVHVETLINGSDTDLVFTGDNIAVKWTLRNTGNRAWPPGSHMIFEHGARMGAPGLIMLPEVGPGEVHTVLVQMQIPKSTGRHVATWTVRTSWGHCFSVVPFAVTAVHQDEELSGAIETIRAMGFTDISDHDLVQLLISHGMQITDDLVNALASD